MSFKATMCPKHPIVNPVADGWRQLTCPHLTVKLVELTTDTLTGRGLRNGAVGQNQHCTYSENNSLPAVSVVALRLSSAVTH